MIAEVPGTLDVVTGTMFSGKTERFIDLMRRVSFANQRYLAFKPTTDKRSGMSKIRSKEGKEIDAIELEPEHALRLLDLLDAHENEYGKCHVIGIDEAQFFPAGGIILTVLTILVSRGYRVIVAGLDLNYRGEPFGAMPEIMALADNVTKLTAACRCGSQHARFPQRMLNGQVASFEGPLVQIGGIESYEARCRKCFVFPGLGRSPRAISRINEPKTA